MAYYKKKKSNNKKNGWVFMKKKKIKFKQHVCIRGKRDNHLIKYNSIVKAKINMIFLLT